MFEPPICKQFSNDELQDFVNYKNNPIRKITEDFPSNTIAVERAVKMVTESSTLSSDLDKRNGLIHSKILLKQVLKKNDTKSDFIDFMNKDLFE